LLGSGFVYDKKGHIVTNNHVVPNASAVIVSFNDGNQYDTKVIGKDPVNDIDFVQILNSSIIEQLVPVQLANSSSTTIVRIGEQVFTIGNSYGFQIR
jgi:S1-C subfamily serine protease